MTNILVVEDDVKLNYIVCSVLNDHGYHAISCSNAAEAFDRMLEGSVHMIISDIMMPEMDGFTACEKIRALDNDHAKLVPIIAMTANAFTEDIQKCLFVGMNDHISKPIDIDILFSKTSEYLK